MKKPSITKILEQLNKKGLLNWANKIGLEGISLEDYRKESTNKGINNHSKVESFILHGESTGDEDFDNRISDFISEYNVISCEGNVDHEYYIGRYDILAEKDGKTYVFDMKSSNRVYFNQVLQLYMYKMSLGVDEIGIINIPSMKVKLIELIDENSIERYCKSIINMWYLERKCKWNLNE